ncbi:hypothetical protein D4764_19G0000780 [Takifugu flavidus]|uniref:Uncharacterized protein n=1 Tax=Takifugu flavidus TaxID=433684 RepID=A0A5C6NQ74_9TELE|nr:hypothetical protein D4764_19G0000780 [Takifugu flavidus]
MIEQEVPMEVMENETWTHSSYVPHYLLRGDPFASRLSKEADIVAALYICIIGAALQESYKMASRSPPLCMLWKTLCCLQHPQHDWCGGSEGRLRKAYL